jgi:P27 family predicted phage terminase small subunit
VTSKPAVKPPKHLRAATRRWWANVVEGWDLDEHHVRLLTAAGEAWDRAQQAREALAEHGVVFVDRFGQPHARPEVAMERDSRIAFARLLRELALDVEEPGDGRPPTIQGQASRRGGR